MTNPRNAMQREAARAMSQLALTRIGIVSGYDPNTYSAKVRLQPEDTETGWLPIASPWVGNSWGLFAPPEIGDVVEVRFQEGSRGAGMIGLRHYGNRLKPLEVPSGEFWLQHQSGSYLKFKNDGSVELHAATAITSSAPVWNHTGDVNIDGEVRATGDIYDLNGEHGSFGYLRQTYNIHTHPISGGTTTQPNQQIE